MQCCVRRSHHREWNLQTSVITLGFDCASQEEACVYHNVNFISLQLGKLVRLLYVERAQCCKIVYHACKCNLAVSYKRQIAWLLITLLILMF
jgi:hypothetical protein